MPTCPKCGYQNLEAAKFCQSCGTPLIVQTPSQPVAPAPMPYYTLPPRQGMRSEEKAIIIVVLLVGILVVGTVTAALIYTPFKLSRVIPRPAPVIMTGFILHIQYPNSASYGYFGSATRPLNAPFILYLQHDQEFRGNFTLTLSANSVPHSVDSISITSSPGFTLLSVSPILPRVIQPGSFVNFTVTCQAPNNDYTGPVTLNLVPS